MFSSIGITVLGLAVLSTLLAITGLDLWLVLKHNKPLGRVLEHWSQRYPLFSAGLAVVLGVLLGHFFWL